MGKRTYDKVYIRCPHCRVGYWILPKLTGRGVRCRKCSNTFIIDIKRQ
ncbi:MAG: hypothetical protein WC919_01190 [Candidatus Paceibacterota bacterium]